jgi:UDP-glucose:glycoprotein glucosyltransferase
VFGNSSAPASILYADITSPTFGQFHKTLIRTAREGKTSYRVRHRKPLSLTTTPLEIGGYGVELALKRTDYIVIDDRNEEDVKANIVESKQEVMLDDDELADLKPLSTSELLSLGLKASSFVVQSENPFETLIKLSQDFPKYSTTMAAHNASKEFLAEHSENRGLLVPSGVNIMWINGVQIVERQVDAFTLLDILRREKRLIDSVRELGLTGPEAVKLLSHSAVAVAKSGDEPQRFDWTDTAEGENVIVWLNDIEKDKRYEGWPTDLKTVSMKDHDFVGTIDKAIATTEDFPRTAPVRS